MKKHLWLFWLGGIASLITVLMVGINIFYSEEYSRVLNKIVAVGQEKANNMEAESLYRQALQTAWQVEGEPRYAVTLKELGAFYQDKDHYQVAYAFYRDSEPPLGQQAMEIKAKKPGKKSLEYAAALDILGLWHLEKGDYQKAERLLWKALQIKEKKLGRQHPDYAASLYFLGVLYLDLGTLYQNMSYYQGSEWLLQQALQIWERDPGEQHPDYATAIDTLTELHRRMDDYPKAEPLQR